MITGVAMEETRITDSIERVTLTTSLGCVARINVFNINSSSESFVFNESLELIITPSTEYAIESSASAFCSYPFQVLHYNNTCLTIVLDNSFTDYMVDISHEPFLPTAETLKMSLGRLSAFTLETTAESAYSFESGLYTTEELPVGCNSKFAYADINPDQVCAESELDVFSNKNMYEIISASFDDISTACSPVNIFTEIFWHCHRHFESAIDCGNTDYTFIEFRPEVAKVISDRYILHSFGFNVLCNNFDCLTRELGRQFSFCPDNRIAFIVDTFESTEMSMLESNPDGFIEFGICFRNRIIDWEFDSYNCFGTHNNNIAHKNINNYLQNNPQFLPRLKSWASLRKDT
jgi:hypothetical protein